MSTRRTTMLLVLAVSLLATACGGGGTDSPIPPARLASLDVTGLDLDPPFDPGVHAYEACPGLLQKRVEVLAAAESTGLRVAVNGKPVPPDTGLIEVELDAAATELVISILDENGRTLADYEVRLDRSFALDRTWLKATYPGEYDRFGADVAVSGQTLAIAAHAEDGDGDPEDDDSLSGAGAVYVFVREAGVWTQQAYLKSWIPADHALFGSALDISGDTLVVGAQRDNHIGVTTGDYVPECGAAYVYLRTGTTWDLQGRLEAPYPDTDDEFGCSVAIDGDTIVVGSRWESSDESSPSDDSLEKSGAAYVFERQGASWIWVDWLKADPLHAIDLFGTSVAISGDRIVVGAPGEDSDGSNPTDTSLQNAGAVYVFRRGVQAWTQEAWLKAAVPGDWDSFGSCVDVDGETVVVGASGERSDGSSPYDDSLERAGAVYVFEPAGGGWTQTGYLKPHAIDEHDMFGRAVAIHGDTLCVGASLESSDGSTWFDNSLSGSGAAYLFVRQDAGWVQGTYLKASNRDTWDFFGSAVALGDGIVVVGASGEGSDGSSPDDNSLIDAGAAYVFE